MIPSPRYWFYMTVILILLAGCSPSTAVLTATLSTAKSSPTAEASPTAKPSPTAEQSQTAEPSPATFETFNSERPGYTIDYPDSWLVTERAGEWKIGDLLFQHAAGVDTISAPGDSGMVVIGAQQIPDGTTLDQWMNTNTELFLGLFGGTCGEPETGEPTTIGGEAAITRI